MEKPGNYLKRQREIRGIALEDISTVTRVPMKYLAALEGDAHENLPHPTFVKGFIRLYCKHVGIDSNDAVLHYEEYLNIRDNTSDRLSGFTNHGLKHDRISKDSNEPAGDLSLSRQSLFLIVMFIFIIITAYIGFLFYNKALIFERQIDAASGLIKDSSELSNKGNFQTIINAEAIGVDNIDRSISDANRAQEETQAFNKLKLEIKATKPTWIRATIDDKKSLEVLMRDKENIVWEAEKRFFLIIGNAGGVRLILNGEPLGKLGSDGEVIKLVLPQEAVN